MDLFEYQGKQYFAKYNIPVSAGGVAHTVDEAVAEAEKQQDQYPYNRHLRRNHRWQIRLVSDHL